MTKPNRKTAHEQALELIRTGVETLFRCSNEPRLVAVAVAWRGHPHDQPAGLVMGPDGEPVGALEMTRLLEQMARLTGFVVQQIDQVAQQAQKGFADESTATEGQRRPEGPAQRGPEEAPPG